MYLNKTKNAGIIKYKKRSPKKKELLNLFNDLLDTILTDKTLMTSKDKNEKEKEKENGNENENDETLMSSKDDDDENEDDDETMDQNNKSKIIKGTNDLLDEITDKSKSFEEQIKSSKKLEGLKGYWPYNDFGDKELKFKYFKIELADMSNEIEEKLFKKIFGHTFETLANKLINTKSKEENQIIVKNVNKSKEKIYEIERSSNFIVQSGDLRANLKYNLDLILDFNETI